jgi:hypothetical protein
MIDQRNPMQPITRPLLLAFVLFLAAGSKVGATTSMPSSAQVTEARDHIGPGKRRCAAYGRKHLRRGKCGRRNRRLESFLKGYSW